MTQDKYSKIVRTQEILDEMNPYIKRVHRYQRSFVISMLFGLAATLGCAKLADHYNVQAMKADDQVEIEFNEVRKNALNFAAIGFSGLGLAYGLVSFIGFSYNNRKSKKFDQNHFESARKLVEKSLREPS